MNAKTQDTVTVQFELTDTFGGEANYSWVRRETVTVPADIKDRTLARMAKAWAGYKGAKGRSEHYNGDSYAFRPSGDCVVLFATVQY